MPETPNATPEVYTAAAEILIQELRKIFAQKDGQWEKVSATSKFDAGNLHISDVRDIFGRQCVDLVQEGGGVHGIALAGYTYVLETMGITFTKLAGTSAGAINTTLLHGVLTQYEAEELKKLTPDGSYTVPPEAYLTTRTGKMLEYLTTKQISDFIDGHPVWRKLLLSLFSGKVDFKLIKDEWKRIKRLAIGAGVSLFILLLLATFLVVGCENTPWYCGVKWVTAAAGLAFIAGATLLATRLWQGRLLWLLADKLGINPGENFRLWIKEKMEGNNIKNVRDLRDKLHAETTAFYAHYEGSNGIVPVLQTSGNEEFDTKANAIISKLARVSNDPGETATGRYDAAWDKLLRLAKELPVGTAANDEIGANYVKILRPVFEYAVYLMDDACKYYDHSHKNGDKNKQGPYNKELTLITTDLTNEMKVELPAMHGLYWGNKTDISPAEYVRASMAIPFFFKPYEVVLENSQANARLDAWNKFFNVTHFNPINNSGEPKAQFVDGGAVSNFPINIYATPEMPLSRKPTIGVKLEYEDTLTSYINTEAKEVGSIISTMRYFYDRDFIAKNDMYKRTVRMIDTGGISWLNFNLSEREKLELFYRGALAATLFLAYTDETFEKNGHAELMELATSKKFPETMIEKGQRNEIIDKNDFRHEDLENKDIHFNWLRYKNQRLRAISIQAYQRNQLKKSFPF